MLFSDRPPMYASSCMTISGERTEQLHIFCRITGFMNDFRPPQTSADIYVGHDDLGWKKNEKHVIIGFEESIRIRRRSFSILTEFN